MIITIDNQEDLLGYQTLAGVYIEGGNSVPATLRGLAETFSDREELEVQLHMSIFPHICSYKTNPAQLAKISNASDTFYYKHGYIRKPYIVIVFSTKPPQMTFWQTCLDYCALEGTYTFTYEEVPPTYRHNASLLRYRLKQAVGKKIRVIKTPTLFRLVVPKTKL